VPFRGGIRTESIIRQLAGSKDPDILGALKALRLAARRAREPKP